MATKDRFAPLIEPIGLSREDAAAFISVSPTFFSSLVASGLMPKPKALGARRLWDRKAIERAWQRLPEADEVVKADASDPWSNPVA